MNWPEHFFIGAAVGGILAFLLNLNIFTALAPILMCAFSALVPDIDHQDSKIRQFGNYSVLAAAVLFSILLTCDNALCIVGSWHNIIVLSLAIFGGYNFFMIFLMPHHRGFVHSLTAATLYATILFFITNAHLASFGFAGYLSHLLADKEIKII